MLRFALGVSMAVDPSLAEKNMEKEAFEDGSLGFGACQATNYDTSFFF